MKGKCMLALTGVIVAGMISMTALAAEDDRDIITYDSLYERIEGDSYTMDSINSSIDNSKNDIENIISQMKDRQSQIKRERNQAKKDDDTETYIETTIEDRILSAAIKSYEKALDSFDSNSNTRSIRQVKEQLTASAQTLMISCKAMAARQEILTDMVQIYERRYELLTRQMSIGMVTAADVSNAYAEMLSAKASLQSLEESRISLNNSFYSLIGSGVNAEIDFGSIPKPELSRVETMNPDNDIERAIADNYSLISLRRSHSGTSTQSQQKQKDISLAEQKLYASLKSLYQDAVKASQQYQSALTGFEAATIEMNVANQKYNLGMFSELEYLSAKTSYLQKLNERDSAESSLLQAIESYDWAVSGLGSIE